MWNPQLCVLIGKLTPRAVPEAAKQGRQRSSRSEQKTLEPCEEASCCARCSPSSKHVAKFWVSKAIPLWHRDQVGLPWQRDKTRTADGKSPLSTFTSQSNTPCKSPGKHSCRAINHVGATFRHLHQRRTHVDYIWLCSQAGLICSLYTATSLLF